MNEDRPEDRSPLFPRWSYWYALVIGALLALIGFFYCLTNHFA